MRPVVHAPTSGTRGVRAIVLTALLALVVTVVPTLPDAARAAAPPAGGFVYGGLYDASIQKTPIAEGDGTAKASFDALAAHAGRRPTFGGMFQGITDPDSTAFFLERVWQAQATPFVNIEIPASSARIAGGEFDAQLAAWASGIASWFDRGEGRSAIFAPLQEMNGQWTVWGCDPTNYRAAFTRIRDAVRAAGLDETAVRWAFAPNGWTDPGCGAGADRQHFYYPGDAAVDIVGFSAYNYGAKEWDRKYRFPAEVFGPWLDEIRTYAPDKPVIVAQTGTAPATRAGDDRDGWLLEMYRYLAADPNVVGLVYFNLDKSASGGNEWDWRVWGGSADSSATADAFATGLVQQHTAYAWPLHAWFRPGVLAFGPVERIAGSGRVATSVALAATAFDPSTEAVIIATAGSYPDALTGAPLAAQLGAPILLTGRDALDAATEAELRRLAPNKVILLGGLGALGQGVEDTVRSIVPDTERIAGTSRWATGAAIGTRVTGTSVYVVEGGNADPRRGWPDAVSVSALAAYQQRPIVMTEAAALPAASLQLIRDLGVTNATIVGGPNAVSDDVVAELEAEGVAVTRVYGGPGTSRYDTSAAVAQLMIAAGMSPARTWIATGENWPDALAAAPVIARDGGVLLLVHGLRMEASTAVRDHVRATDVERVRMIGGPNAVTAHIEGELRGLAR